MIKVSCYFRLYIEGSEGGSLVPRMLIPRPSILSPLLATRYIRFSSFHGSFSRENRGSGNKTTKDGAAAATHGLPGGCSCIPLTTKMLVVVTMICSCISK